MSSESGSAPLLSSPVLRSEAWLRIGLFSSIPGELILADGVLSFIAYSAGSAWPSQLRALERSLRTPGLADSIEQGRAMLCVQWQAQAVESWAPWYFFGGGLNLKHERVVLSFGFSRPANMDVRLGAVDELRKQLRAVRIMRARCRRWMAALSA